MRYCACPFDVVGEVVVVAVVEVVGAAPLFKFPALPCPSAVLTAFTGLLFVPTAAPAPAPPSLWFDPTCAAASGDFNRFSPGKPASPAPLSPDMGDVVMMSAGPDPVATVLSVVLPGAFSRFKEVIDDDVCGNQRQRGAAMALNVKIRQEARLRIFMTYDTAHDTYHYHNGNDDDDMMI